MGQGEPKETEEIKVSYGSSSQPGPMESRAWRMPLSVNKNVIAAS